MFRLVSVDQDHWWPLTEAVTCTCGKGGELHGCFFCKNFESARMKEVRSIVVLDWCSTPCLRLPAAMVMMQASEKHSATVVVLGHLPMPIGARGLKRLADEGQLAMRNM